MTTDDPADRPSDRRHKGTATADLSESEYGIYECADCENVVLSLNDAGSEMVCHGQEMVEVTDCDLQVQPPELRRVLFEVFDLPKPGIDICLQVVDGGPQSARQIADRLDFDRSTVSRYLNELVELGLLEKRQLNREAGGVVNVYHATDLQRMGHETLVGFYVWAGEAASLIEQANSAKSAFAGDDAVTDPTTFSGNASRRSETGTNRPVYISVSPMWTVRSRPRRLDTRRGSIHYLYRVVLPGGGDHDSESKLSARRQSERRPGTARRS